MQTEIEQTIRTMFDNKNNRDLADLMATNQQLLPLIENSERVLGRRMSVRSAVIKELYGKTVNA
jgi:hypothetical protein